jgi:hypothetical protein
LHPFTACFIGGSDRTWGQSARVRRASGARATSRRHGFQRRRGAPEPYERAAPPRNASTSYCRALRDFSRARCVHDGWAFLCAALLETPLVPWSAVLVGALAACERDPATPSPRCFTDANAHGSRNARQNSWSASSSRECWQSHVALCSARVAPSFEVARSRKKTPVAGRVCAHGKRFPGSFCASRRAHGRSATARHVSKAILSLSMQQATVDTRTAPCTMPREWQPKAGREPGSSRARPSLAQQLRENRLEHRRMGPFQILQSASPSRPCTPVPADPLIRPLMPLLVSKRWSHR